MFASFFQMVFRYFVPTLKKPIIQSLWIGRELSVIECLAISSWLRYKYEFHLYSYNNIKNLPEGAILKDAREIVPEELLFAYQNGSYAAFSNLFRYALLYKNGNIWTDLDIVCVNPSYFKSRYIIVSEEDRFGNIFPATFFLKAPKGSEVMKYAYGQTLEMREKVLSGEIQWQIGRTTINQILEKFDLVRYVVPPKYFTINDWEHIQSFLNPDYDNVKYPSRMEDIPPETIAIHLWHEVFRREHVDITKRYPENSIFERLKTKFLTPRIANLTVVIPTSNSSKYLGRTLDYLSQYFANIIVGVDYKSDSETRNEALKYDCSVINIRNITEPSRILEQFIPQCKSEWVLYLNDRDMISKKAISKLKVVKDFTLSDISQLSELVGRIKYINQSRNSR